jgi:hypothetical protein
VASTHIRLLRSGVNEHWIHAQLISMQKDSIIVARDHARVDTFAMRNLAVVEANAGRTLHGKRVLGGVILGTMAGITLPALLLQGREWGLGALGAFELGAGIGASAGLVWGLVPARDWVQIYARRN